MSFHWVIQSIPGVEAVELEQTRQGRHLRTHSRASERPHEGVQMRNKRPC
ncbi:Hypotetical protein [Gulosibacter molinativorax]|nr:Hypotetical protein [Gulosibacter molinativorax]